ncbi:hypothetical protein FRC07_001933 [Ceratobasidium sp. 392]|nr:hypothetical protein FRC07_001933 [Ceratobasidium sp. 392]
MAKRGSDHQLTRDDDSDGDEEVQVGMAKADPTAPRFSGFSGFGAPAASTAPPAPPKPVEPPRFAGFTGFGAALPPKTDAPTETKPAEAPRFTAFTGFGSVKPAAPAQPTPEASKAPQEPVSDSAAALTYWTSLRGLNHAFMESAKRAVETDVFCDIGELFAQYKEHREKIIKDFDNSKKAAAPQPATKPAAPAPEAPKPAPPTTETKSPFSFGSSASTTKDAAPSPFSFGSAKSSAPAPKPSSFGLNLPSGKPTFGPSDPALVTPSATPPVVPPSPKKPAATFGAFGAGAVPDPTPTPSPLPEGRAPNVFDIAAAKSTAQAETPKPPTFSFGSSAPSANPFANLTPKPDAKPFSFNTSNSSAALASPAISTTATAGSSVPPTAKSFAFSTPLSTPGTPFAFGAGSPKGGATPKPGGGSVGFSFGSSPPRKETAGFPFGSVPTGSGASSAVQTPKGENGSDEEKAKEGGEATAEGADTTAAGEDEDRSQAEGAGEENEDTLFAARARVLRFYKQSWVGVGIGNFKIKYDRETKKRRVLHRLEGTGRVVVNISMFEHMEPVKEPKGVLRFTGTDDEGHPMLYRVKVKTDEEAEALIKVFNEALEAVKAAKSSA